MAANALIFDLDGTVWDSATWFATALGRGNDVLTQATRISLIQGGNIIGALAQANMSRARLLSDAARYGPVPLFPGMREALDELSAKSVPMAVATSLPGTLALPMIAAANLDGIFTAVIHAGTCRQAKPNPRSIHMALGSLGLSASLHSVYVGDRMTDAEAANRAGISFAWVAHGYETPADDSGVVVVEAGDLLAL